MKRVEKWVTRDGREFNTKELAELHERKLDIVDVINEYFNGIDVNQIDDAYSSMDLASRLMIARKFTIIPGDFASKDK